MPTEHSWVLPLLKASEERVDEMEEKLNQWITTQTKELEAQRIIRESLVYLLENKAIEALIAKNPSCSAILPSVRTPEEATILGAREAMITSETPRLAAKVILTMILQEKEAPIDLSE